MTPRPLLLLFILEIYSEMLEIQFEVDLVHGIYIQLRNVAREARSHEL